MINDLISDGLTRIRNASMRRLDTTKLLHSNVVEATLKILADKGYIESYNVVEEGNKKFINVVLKYDERGRSVINELKRVSKPGRRVYQGKDEIKRFKNGYGTIIVSTSKGVLSNDEAHKIGVGGEVLCTVW
ncbi:30S ribosomal protein S8 [Campylobacter hyointestinalis]|uniref:Small ribosomal subunit protein uS8 n=1 Tax=Campylobacter hyointestinalis subsp. hyointestinalis TaxID=91352 RepID=A0A855N3G6_CAMHY|nr:30S ribosomal protein S8 [Campylobacter hyointestinalis]ANE31817.1 30S ribosomal protein S8 [Campylobacter hyointestinalis subsp. hyointestinalis LMG 9260]KEA44119.1 30S ribosomal protein S8 [Campylobacter hyointestinalis subsp. hyointestinalis]MBT0612354.1 30S ribosomal protein S8 [Campylobacter hyointestinalis subsp. hyointestinalis]MDL2346042.1 30S ribosomal protein S8 [Campylobacter hyointestinalis]MDL2347782.1 30S ribosomal protein S8 [Campylobacter hyointestinalis]